MQRSPNRHVFVRLRRELEMTQSQFGRLVGLSRASVQGIELLALPLSERAAHRISEELDLNVGWLLENRLTEEPTNRRGQPWNLDWFEVAQMGTWRGGYRVELEPLMGLFRMYHQMRWIVGPRDMWKLGDFMIAKQKALADLWETIPDREERNKAYRAYRQDRLSDKQLLNLVISDARKVLGAIHDLEKRIKRSPEPARSPGKKRRKVKRPLSAKDAPTRSLVSP
jgi:transcriptional regulator with XRE-family HTH domain